MSCPALEEVWQGDCPALEKCRRLVAEAGVCPKYSRRCSLALGCFVWGYECDFRYDDREGYEI